ncbi:MAG: carbohydrate kinase family protein [Planctomycetaceae bacterium]|nr:carbohydrate kinase family protein [Planctomycetaceae bacterium]
MSVWGIGTVVVDHVVELPQFPGEDTKAEILFDWQQMGGPVPVALSTASHFGSRCRFRGRCGADGAGDYIRRTLQQRGIEFEDDARSDADWATGFAQVWVTPSGSRTIAYSRGRFPVLTADDVDTGNITADTVLHLDGWAADAAVAAAKAVRAAGGRVVLDAGSVKPGLNRLLPLVDVLIASQLFRQSYFGQKHVDARLLLSLGPADVLTTDGEQGATWLRRDGRLQVEAVAVVAVDTNGAGDVFAGAVVHGLDRGWSAERVLTFANEVAGYSCGFRGNSSLPDSPSQQ